MNCPQCSAEIQATREVWLSFTDDGAVRSEEGTLRIYCREDHELDNDRAVVAWVTTLLSPLRPAPETCEDHPGVALADGECPECAAAFDRSQAES